MIEPGTVSSDSLAPGASAGALLRAAREKQGLHLGALAAAIKVTPRKLEALEGDRLDELPDLTFARALAQTVCRALRTDAAPVLALLPLAPQTGPRLDHMGGGLNTPFHDRPGQRRPSESPLKGKPILWATGGVLVAAAVVALLPEQGVGTRVVAPGPAASAASLAAAASAQAAREPLPAASGALVETVFSAPPEPAGSAPDGASVPAGPLLLRASAETWVEVVDGAGQNLISRNLQAGEAVGLDGAMPLRVRIGNVAGMTLSFRGQPVDLQPVTRDNVARLELK